MHSRPISELYHSQNFLKSRRLVDELLDRSSIDAADLVLEIGPGRGRITERLVQRCRQVLAVEQDRRLVRVLRDRLAGASNLTIVEADFLATQLPRQPYKVFANLPFNRTTEIVTKLTAAARPPEDAYLALQREAAARFTGQPRGSLWAALLVPFFEPTIVHHFRRTDFDPPPRVDVVMLRLRKRGPPLLGRADRRLYRDLVTHCFAAWRPDLLTTVSQLVGRARARQLLQAAGLCLEATPSTLEPEQWLALFGACTTLDRRAALAGVARAEARLRSQQRRLLKPHRTRRPPSATRDSPLAARR